MSRLLKATVFLALMMACLVMLVSPLLAQSCYSGAAASYGYQASYSYAPAVTYAPAASYSTVSYAPAKAVSYQVQEVLVPKAVKAYVNADYFASTDSYYRDKLLVDAVAGKVNDTSALQRELQELKAQLQRTLQPQAYPQQQYQQVPQGYGQQGYSQPQGGTPCDWRAQQAYELGRREAAQQYGQQGYQAPPQQQRQDYGGSQGNASYPEVTPQTPRYPQGQQSVPQYPQGQPHRQQGYPRGGQYERQPQEQRDYPHGGQPQSRPQEGQQGQPPQGQQGSPPTNHAPSSQERDSGEGQADHGGVPEGLDAVVGQSCLRCHGPSNADDGKGFDLRNLQAVPLELRMESYTQVVTGDMPHKAERLPPDKVKLFRAWYKLGKRSVAVRP